MTSVSGPPQSSVAISVFCSHVCTIGNKHFCYIPVASTRGLEQRRPAEVLLCVHIGAPVEKDFGDILVAE